jgi:transcriptional regulator GlxA family with amidase domain
MDLASLSRFGFLTLPDYSMIAVANAIEACRMANRVAGQDVYAWQVLSLDGKPVTASNGLTLTPTVRLDSVAPPELLFVCGGVHVRAAATKPLLAALRRTARRGMLLGALCTGAFVLAEAGLLEGYRCAIHWENLAASREEFPETEFVNDLFVVDRDRITCTGGTAPLDMMLSLVQAKLGRGFAEQVSAEFIHERVRPSSEHQPVAGFDRSRISQPLLARAVSLIEANIEQRLPVVEIARQLAISPRQLQRLFHRGMGRGPAAFAQELRLKRAQHLLRQMDMRITEVALTCGFSSTAYFSSAYREYFGHPPRREVRDERPYSG